MRINEMSTTLVTVEEEYMKNPELKKEDIAILNEWCQSQPNLPNVTEIQLILFHHSCYFNMDETKSCINTYYKLRQNTPEFFNDRFLTLPEMKNASDVTRCAALPVKDPNGYQIIFNSLQQFEPSKYVFTDCIKLLFMAPEACSYIEGTVPGYVYLFDMTGVQLGHLARLSLTYLRKMLTYFQDGIPVRLKAIHIVNTHPLINKVMFMMKPFMRKELLKLIHFHSSNYEEVQRYLPKSCLPCDFGGDLPSCSELHEKFIKWITSLEPFFKEEQTLCQAKKISKANNESKRFSPGGLELD